NELIDQAPEELGALVERQRRPFPLRDAGAFDRREHILRRRALELTDRLHRRRAAHPHAPPRPVAVYRLHDRHFTTPSLAEPGQPPDFDQIQSALTKHVLE